MAQVYFHPEARAEALAAAQFYAERHSALGRRFVNLLAEAIARIQDHPSMYPAIGDELRQARLGTFPYGLIFRFTEDRVDVLAVMHLRRDPGYFRSRSFVEDEE